MDKDEIGAALVRNVLATPDTGGRNSTVNKALGKLRTKIEGKLDELEQRIKDNEGIKDKWQGVIHDPDENGNTIIPQFQVQVIRWADFRRSRTKRLQYNVGQIAKHSDSSGKWLYNPGTKDEMEVPLGETRSLYPQDDDLSRNGKVGSLVNNYFEALFCKQGAPLKSVGDFLDVLDREYPSYDVTLSLDYYYTRPLSQLGLHKDTTGNTVFVGLHYNNEQQMVGPEYMYDFWPSFDKRAYSPHHVGKDGALDAGVRFWPKTMRDGLENARDQFENRYGDNMDKLYMTEMSPHGLICFVDELVFHQTPLTRRRIRGSNKDPEKPIHERRTLFMDATFGGFTLDLVKAIGAQNMVHQHPMRLRRQLSEVERDNGNYWGSLGKKGGTGGMQRRSFVRFWAMLEPRVWFKP